MLLRLTFVCLLFVCLLMVMAKIVAITESFILCERASLGLSIKLYFVISYHITFMKTNEFISQRTEM